MRQVYATAFVDDLFGEVLVTVEHEFKPNCCETEVHFEFKDSEGNDDAINWVGEFPQNPGRFSKKQLNQFFLEAYRFSGGER